MIRLLRSIVFAFAAWLVVPATAYAAESYDNCTGFITSLPTTISTQGTWCLDQHLSTNIETGGAITVATNNVTIDCNHFKIGGLAAGVDTQAYGVLANDRFNTTIRHCNIRGFHYGILFTGGGGHLVDDNSFDSNTFIGINVSSAGSTIRGNSVLDIGGTPHATGQAYGIVVGEGVDVIDNTVNGIMGTADVYGIWADTNAAGGISGNRIRGLAPGSGAAYGIHVANSVGIVIRGNDVQGSGSAGIGILCDANGMAIRDNVVIGFATGIQSCHADANTVLEF